MTDESTLGKVLLASVIYYVPRDLALLILIWVIPKECSLRPCPHIENGLKHFVFKNILICVNGALVACFLLLFLDIFVCILNVCLIILM